MDRGNWWSNFFNNRLESIERLNLAYRRKWNKIDCKLYNINNIDKDIDKILNLEDKDEMKRKLKALTLSHCKTIFEKDTESIAELRDAAVSCVRTFGDKNKDFIRLASIVGTNSKTSTESLIDRCKDLMKMLDE